MKKILKIAGLVIGIIVLLGLLYFLWQTFVSETEEIPIDVANGEPIDFPEPQERDRVITTIPKGEEVVSVDQPGMVLSRVSSSDNSAFYLWKDGSNDLFYITNEGFVVRAIPQGDDEMISSQSINALGKVISSPSGDNILASFGNPLSPDWAIFSLDDNSWSLLPNNVITANWGIDDNNVYAIEENNNGQRSLILINTSNLDNIQVSSTVQNNLNLRDITLKFISPNIYIMERPSAHHRGSIWSYNINSRSLSRPTERDYGLFVNWTQDNEIAFRFSSPSSMTIESGSLTSVISRAVISLPNKCGGVYPVVYCFVTQTLEGPGLTMPDSYLQKDFFSVDSLVIFNLETRDINVPFHSAIERIPAIDATNIIYNDGYLMFKNRYDDSIYRLSIPEEMRPEYEPPQEEISEEVEEEVEE